MVGQSLDSRFGHVPAPRRNSVAGIGASVSSVAMMFFGLFIGFVLQTHHGNYVPVFLLAGSAYLVAIGVIHLLAPRLAVITLD
jgi:ACS family hexuronate transporter-like MFS transporter